jgi:hypothetical protein
MNTFVRRAMSQSKFAPSMSVERLLAAYDAVEQRRKQSLLHPESSATTMDMSLLLLASGSRDAELERKIFG